MKLSICIQCNRWCKSECCQVVEIESPRGTKEASICDECAEQLHEHKGSEIDKG